MTNPIADPLVENVIVDDVASVVKLESTPEGVATVTISRPAKRNALDLLSIEGLTEAFETLQGADHVRVVFLKGAGGNFCAGGDVLWTAASTELSESENREDAMTLAKMFKALADIPAVTVALVEGAAMGAGGGLIAACDLAVAVQGARIAFPEARLGITASVIAPYVVGAIGPRAAKALFVTAREIDADRALALGLVQEVAADVAALVAAEARIVSEVMACAPGAIADVKRLVWDVWARPLDHGLMEETARHLAHRRVSEEGREGVDAFIHRRKPDWAS